MKITEKVLRKMIREEVEVGETAEEAYEANLNDEKIIRFFEEGINQEEQLAEISSLDEAALLAQIPRLVSALKSNKMIQALIGKIAEDPKAAAQFLSTMAQMVGIDTDKTFTGRQKSVAKSLDNTTPQSEPAADDKDGLVEGLIREVLNEIFGNKDKK